MRESDIPDNIVVTDLIDEAQGFEERIRKFLRTISALCYKSYHCREFRYLLNKIGLK